MGPVYENYAICLLLTYLLVIANGFTTSRYRVKARYNTTEDKQSVIQFCSYSIRNSTATFDCSFKSLTYVPPIPPGCIVVNVSNNLLGTIWFSPFWGLSELRVIDLSSNPLFYITESLFSGLFNLKELYLRNTLLYKQPGLDIGTLLSRTVSLEKFAFTFQFYGQISPIPCSVRKVLPFSGDKSVLTSIKSLEIDSVLLPRINDSNAWTTMSFKTSQLELVNGFCCFYTDFKKERFVHMSQLIHLSVINPYLMAAFTDDVFAPLINLRTVSVYGNSTPASVLSTKPQAIIQNVTTSIARADHLQTLRFADISRQRSFLSCDDAFSKISRHKSLAAIYLQNNCLSFHDLGDCSFPVSLRAVHLNDNCFSYSNILNLVIADSPYLEFIYAARQNNCRLRSPLEQQKPIHDYVSRNQPTRLKVLIFTHSIVPLYNINDFTQSPWKYLKHLDLSSNSGITYDRSSIPAFFSSLFPAVEYLDLSSCQLSVLQTNCFLHFTMLKRVFLSFNNLGAMKDELYERLRPLSALIELKLDNNKLERMPEDAFDEMHKLRLLDLSGNNIREIKASFRNNMQLEYLNLGNNRLSKLTKSNMDELDMIGKHGRITVDLSGNNFLCQCDTLQMLQWMRTTQVHLFNRDKYTCVYSNETETLLTDLTAIVQDLDQKCASKLILIIVVCIAASLMIALLISGLVYRYRWRLRYLYHMTKLQLRASGAGQHEYDRIFDFDAFISYSSDDYEVARCGSIAQLEDARALRLCIHERDFPPGESIAFNISRSIHNSRCTLLFISSAFLESEWCMYELNIARMESLHSERSVILVVLLEEVDTRRLPLEVLDIIHTYTYLEYPASGNEQDIDVFWNKCFDFINGK